MTDKSKTQYPPERDFEAELEESIEALRAFNRGENNLRTRTVVRSTPPVATIRKRLNVSQHAFAGLLGVSVRTVQEWEQGRREPSGPAQALLRIADQHPEVFLDLQ
jgi:putative transcriptional regulator